MAKNVSLLKWLLSFEALDVNDRDITGSTGAIIAAGNGMTDGIEMLLNDARVDFELTNMFGESALSAASRGGHIHIVALLLGSGRISLSAFGATALSQAISRGHGGIVTLLLARPDIDVNHESRVPNRTGLARDHSEPGTFRATPLVLAARCRNDQVVGQILAHPTFDRLRSNVAAALFATIDCPNLMGFVRLLGNDLTMRNWAGESLVAAAIRRGAWQILSHILGIPGFDPAQFSGMDLLTAVAQTVRFDITAASLLSTFTGVDVNIPAPYGINGFPDLPRSSDARKISVGISMLFSGGAFGDLVAEGQLDGNIRGKHGETLLFHPDLGQAHASEMDINATDWHGNTAWICGVLSRRSPIPQISPELRRIVADSTIRNENGNHVWEVSNARAKRRCSARVEAKKFPRRDERAWRRHPSPGRRRL
jgi:ankyrin repeat protein